jgi:LysR family hydrogen peroxide-inducible transcriptional activator
MSDLDRITLKQIRYFLAVAEHGSFRRTADRMEITQPTLTAQIAALEKALDVKLFERSRSGTWLSAAGRELLVSGRQVLEEAKGFVDLAASLTGGTAVTYRLGVTPTLGPYLLPQILPAIHAEYENLRLYVREAAPADLEEQLKNASHDLILTTEPIVSHELEVAPLFRESVKLVMSREHRLATKPRINRADLLGEAVLTIGEHHLFHRQISELCERLGAVVRRDFEGTSLDTLRQMVVMGMGIAFLPALYVKSEIRTADELLVQDLHGINVFRSHALVWRPRSPARVLFRDLADRIRRIAASTLSADVSVARS